MPIGPRALVFTLAAVALGCASNRATSTPPAFDSTEAATAFASGAEDADLVVHVEVTTRLNEVLPHHMAHAQLAFINRSNAPIALPRLGTDALKIDGDSGRLRRKGMPIAPSREDRVMLAPGQMLISNVDLLDVYDFPADGGRFRIRFEDADRLPAKLKLRTNADYFTVGPRRL